MAETSPRPLSCLDISDIEGASPKRMYSPTRRIWQSQVVDSLDVHSMNAVREKSPTRALKSLNTSDIPGATPLSRCGNRDWQPGVPYTYMQAIKAAEQCSQNGRYGSPTKLLGSALGRWPQPSAHTFEFSQQPRKTVIQKPLNMM